MCSKYIKHQTLNSTFEERQIDSKFGKRGKLAVNLKKEANWLYQLEERVNKPHLIIYPTYVSQKKKRKGEEVEG